MDSGLEWLDRQEGKKLQQSFEEVQERLMKASGRQTGSHPPVGEIRQNQCDVVVVLQALSCVELFYMYTI